MIPTSPGQDPRPSLFRIPEAVLNAPAPLEFPAGGIGAGRFTLADSREFRRWRIDPAAPEDDRPAPFDRFHLWTQQGRETASVELAGGTVSAVRRLFPMTWTEFETESPVRVSSLAFSPLLAGEGFERGLPLHVVAWRVHNPTPRDCEAALLLTWACGRPDPVPEAAYDFQHDNLCLTGSLGGPDSPNRQGIAVPDLHYVGIYQQGIEPWDVPGEREEVLEDFAEDGELDPRVAGPAGQGAAAWVKFTLEPGETKEVPFVLAWHFPFYETGPAAGGPRWYTQFLGRQRPDNAVVWLAEQAVQHFGAEVPNYAHWAQALLDGFARESAARPPEEALARRNALRAAVEADAVWTPNGPFTPLSPVAEWEAIRESWPDLAGPA